MDSMNQLSGYQSLIYKAVKIPSRYILRLTGPACVLWPDSHRASLFTHRAIPLWAASARVSPWHEVSRGPRPPSAAANPYRFPAAADTSTSPRATCHVAGRTARAHTLRLALVSGSETHQTRHLLMKQTACEGRHVTKSNVCSFTTLKI